MFLLFNMFLPIIFNNMISYIVLSFLNSVINILSHKQKCQNLKENNILILCETKS